MKRPVATLLLAATLGAAVFSAAAQSVGVSTRPTVQDGTRSDIATRDVRDAYCLRDTGSLITAAQNQKALRRARAMRQPTVQVSCAGFGRAYTRDDLRRTGASNLSDALRQLDPSIH